MKFPMKAASVVAVVLALCTSAIVLPARAITEAELKKLD